jgi:hypothetical protein
MSNRRTFIIVCTAIALLVSASFLMLQADSPQEVSTESPPDSTVVDVTTTVPVGPSPQDMEAFYQAVQQQVFYDAVIATTPPVTAPPVTVPPVTAPPVTIPAPPVPVVEFAAGTIQDMICATFGDQCAKALSVVQCESNFNPNVVGGAGERGLFQIHPVHANNLGAYGGWDAMFDPAANIAYAYALYSGSGWGPWTCA